MAPDKPFDPSRLHRPPKATPAEVAFITALARHQEGEGWNNHEMADYLGVSWELWRKTKNGVLPLGWKLWAAGDKVAGYQLSQAAHMSLMKRAQESWGRKDPDGEAA